MLMWLTKHEYLAKLEKINEINIQREYRQSIKQERNKYKKKTGVETSKLIAIYLFILLNSIIVYAMVAMWKFVDFSYLGILISDIAAQVLIYAIYCLKAYHGKKQEEKLKFDREKLAGNLNDILDSGSQSSEIVPLTNGTLE